MIHSRRKPRTQDTFSQAGWLFADLLLALAVIFLLFSAKKAPELATPVPSFTPTPTLTRTPTPTVTLTPTPTSTVTPTATPVIPGDPAGIIATPIETPIMDPAPKFCEFTVSLTGLAEDEPSAVNKVKHEILKCYGDETGKRVAGVIITIGYHRDPLGTGFNLAKNVNRTMKNLFPELFGATVMKEFGWSSTNDEQQGLIRVEAYFINNPNNK